MLRRPVLALFATAPLAVVVLGARGVAAEPPPAPAAPAAAPAAPGLATAEQAAAALAKFKEDYKAKGLKGDDKLTQKDFALAALVKLQHPTIVDALGDVSRESDATLRMLGVIYLGYQKALPGSAGPKATAAFRKAGDDVALEMSCLQAIGALRFLGARPELRDALKAQSFALKKSALKSIGQTQDIRLLQDVLEIVGVKLPEENGVGSTAGAPGSKDSSSSGGKEQTSEGYSRAGAEASVDTGTSGDGDQKAAEAQAKAQAAANEAAARASGGGGPSVGGGDGGSASGKGRGGGGRSTNELLPQVLGVLQQLTGKTFSGPGDFKRWYAANREAIAEKSKALDEAEKKQKSDAAAAAKAPAAAPAK